MVLLSHYSVGDAFYCTQLLQAMLNYSQIIISCQENYRGTMLIKFLDPKNDIAFKRIFGTEEHKDILMHFLNDVLNLSGARHIEDVEFLSPIQDPEIVAKKQSIVDVLCRDAQGIQYIIEMQVAKTKGFEKRAQYYASKAYGNQANVGENYYNLKEVIFIAIADCIIFPEKVAYKSDHVLLDKDTQDHDLKDLVFTFIELPKFTKKPGDVLEGIIEQWCYFFKYAEATREADLSKIFGTHSIVTQAYKALDKFHWTENELRLYEQEKKRVMDERAILEQKLDDALEKGLTQGRAEGKAEGIETGKAEGRAEGIETGKLAVARQLKAMGMTLEQIAQVTQMNLDILKRII